MKIRNHLARDNGSSLAYLASLHVGGGISPRFLVLHYTAGSSVDGTVPKARVESYASTTTLSRLQ